YEVRPGEKLDCLRQLLYAEKGQTLIFTRTKRGTERLAKELVRDGFAAAMIHGDRSQSQRNGALSGFQEGRFQVLVATDIASRGLHVDDVAHVINYDVPKTAEDFIHRVGRTGRAGLRGRTSTLAAGTDVLQLRQIERTLKLKIECLPTDTVSAGAPGPMIQNTLASRTLTALPERCLCRAPKSCCRGVKLRQLASIKSLGGIMDYSDASPSKRNLLFDSFSVHACVPEPVSRGVFRQALNSTSDV